MAQKNPTCSSKDIVLHTQPKKQQTTKQHFVSRIRMQRADSAPAELKAGATSIRPKLRPTIDRMESAPLEPTELVSESLHSFQPCIKSPALSRV